MNLEKIVSKCTRSKLLVSSRILGLIDDKTLNNPNEEIVWLANPEKEVKLPLVNKIKYSYCYRRFQDGEIINL